ncbi:BTB POZ domain-containing 6-like [Paramuricea clavata]|uniref:BTB POZ domain-containing 6-like n=1 Tax=Paramuricea clavata TaxID=317549 RepID=A0A6S7GYI7_PARCT|nr:BTB POZ domain-containing 6-like [Paramuricea clavata]
MAFKYHDDWQSSKKTVLQRNAYMFDNELLSDVSFTCGQSSRIFHAHKYVLATSSAVFYAMFYGNLAQNKSLICIPDAEEDSFEEFLRFLYTDHCKITSAENAIQVMYLAKKYIISSLVEKCCKVLEVSIKPDNVFAVMAQAVQFDEKELEAKCWGVVSLHTQECINSEAFCNIASHTLNTLLKKETLAISEVELFKGVLRWTDSECARQGINIEEDKTARRRVLGDSVYEIRFLAMSQKDFAKHVSTTGILTDAESVSIFQKFNGLDVAGLKWEEHTKRQPPPIVSFSRFDLGNISRENWSYNGGSDALTLTVNKSVFFHGVRLFGDSRGSQYEVKFAIKDENITDTYTSAADNDGVYWYDVMLPKPVSLLPGEDVTIIATITGPESYKGINGKSSVKVDDIVEDFENYVSFTGILTDTEITCIPEKLDGLDVKNLKWKEHEKWRQYEVNFTVKDKDQNIKGCYTSEEDIDGVSGSTMSCYQNQVL